MLPRGITCDAKFGPFGNKCFRYKKHRHGYIPVKPTMYPHFNFVMAARETLTRRVETNNTATKIASIENRARIAYESLAVALKRFDNNRHKMDSTNYSSPRKGRASEP